MVSDPNEKRKLVTEIAQRFPNARTVDMMQASSPNFGETFSNGKGPKPTQNGSGAYHQHHQHQAQAQRHNHRHLHGPQETNSNGGGFVAVANGMPIQQSLLEEQETSFIVGDSGAVVMKNATGLCGQSAVVSVGQYYGNSKVCLPRTIDQEADADERLKRYETDLHKRREVEEQKAKEEAFLRYAYDAE